MSISAGANCFRRWGFALAVLALAGATAGCVERRMTIRSNPPGAQVYVDDYEIGTAPVSHGYTYYGTRKIRLVKDGYETLTVYQPMPAPWYDWPGIDFFSENLWPHKVRDERSFEYQMSPIINVPTEELKARAEQLRTASQVVPVGAAQPIAGPPISAPAIVQPQELPPPVMGPPPSTVVTPQNTLPPPNAAPLNGAPNFSTPPANSYPPPGGYPAASPYPGPSYPAPTAPPTNTPGIAPPFGQPQIPPGWRPIGETETPLMR